MTTSEWRRVRDLFEQALERDAPDVHAWLEQQTKDASEMRREVLSLLAHHQRAGAFLSAPLAERAADLFDGDDALKPGAMVGAYEIVREIGRGGMGRVYLASDRRLGRHVALKALPPAVSADAAWRARLEREARAAAALTHPGICAVYAFDEIDGALFIASEFVEGRTLRDEIASTGRPTPHEVLETARELAAALASAHAKGITHRDLKPENVMRTADGRLKIVDFGLARFDERVAGSGSGAPPPRVTEPGLLVGTPAYMAPEQLNGAPADARSDVFAFGVLMYEYASGVHPFDAPTPLAMAGRILEAAALPLERVRPDVPAQAAAVVDRCLRKSPLERWPTAVDLALALARPDIAPVRPAGFAFWWRTHQVVVMAGYCAATYAAWWIKERVHGLADPLFVAIGIAAAVNGILRGHLLFTDWMNPTAMTAERLRVEPITLAVDLAMAAGLAASGALMMPTGPLAAMLTIAAAAGIALVRAVLEPATTRAVFGGPA